MVVQVMRLFFVMAWVLLFSVACNVQKDPNRNSGPDGDRMGAVEIPLNRTIIDNVSWVDGDMTDWKYFRVPTQGIIEVVISFDNAAAKGIVIIRRATGEQISRLEHKAEPRLQQTFRADPGVYYLEIFAQTERSDYTLEVLFEQEF